jgi:hypothetical protein
MGLAMSMTQVDQRDEPSPIVTCNVNDRNYSREEYILDSIERIKRGERLYLPVGEMIDANQLPPILRHKYERKKAFADGSTSIIFTLFRGALDEIKQAFAKLNIELNVEEYRGGMLSDLHDMPNALSGYFISRKN